MLRRASREQELFNAGVPVFCCRRNNASQAGGLRPRHCFLSRPEARLPTQARAEPPALRLREPSPLRLVLMWLGPRPRVSVLNISLLCLPSLLPPSYTDSWEGTEAPQITQGRPHIKFNPVCRDLIPGQGHVHSVWNREGTDISGGHFAADQRWPRQVM